MKQICLTFRNFVYSYMLYYSAVAENGRLDLVNIYLLLDIIPI